MRILERHSSAQRDPYPEYVSVPVRRNYCPLHGEDIAMQWGCLAVVGCLPRCVIVLRPQVVITTVCAYQCHFPHQRESLSLSAWIISICVTMARFSVSCGAIMSG